MNRFVVFSDLHLHQWSYGSTLINGRNSRLEGQVQVVKDIIKYCKERDIRQAFFCGDLFHTSTVTAEVSQAAYEAFKGFEENKITLSILVGNHDQADSVGTMHALSGFKYSKYIRVCDGAVHDGPVQRFERMCDAYLYPFTNSKERLEAWLSRVSGGLLFLHQGVGGVEVNSKGFTLNEILTPDMIPDSVIMAFTGHYHSHKVVSKNLTIPGSTTQLNWGDEGEVRGWLDVAIDGGSIHDMQLVPANAPKFVTITEAELNTPQGCPNLFDNFVRVESHGDYSPEDLKAAAEELGAFSVEVKRVTSPNKIIRVAGTSVKSFNEIVLSYAIAQEDAGNISSYDKDVGEMLLKGSYHPPQV